MGNPLCNMLFQDFTISHSENGGTTSFTRDYWWPVFTRDKSGSWRHWNDGQCWYNLWLSGGSKNQPHWLHLGFARDVAMHCCQTLNWHHRQEHINMFHIYHVVFTHWLKNTPTHSHPPVRPWMAPVCHVKTSIWMVKPSKYQVIKHGISWFTKEVFPNFPRSWRLFS